MFCYNAEWQSQPDSHKKIRRALSELYGLPKERNQILKPI